MNNNFIRLRNLKNNYVLKNPLALYENKEQKLDNYIDILNNAIDINLKDKYSINEYPRHLFVKYLLDLKVTEALARNNGKNEKANEIKDWFDKLQKLLRKIFDDDSVILLQNAFPTLEKYIDHVHTVDGKPAKVPDKLEKIILSNFKQLMKLHVRGIKVFFSDIDSIKQKMIEELNNIN